MKIWFLILPLLFFVCRQQPPINVSEVIQPYSDNPKYWQYMGEPVLLVGGTDDDNLFQIPNLHSHLDSLARFGGNYIRNTMSSRPSGGFEVYCFKQLPDSTYDMDQWNPEYWRRFENMLKWTHERNIIVQIEVWDRFDYSRSEWHVSPWNPANNVNYSHEETGFAPEYPKHPSADVQPFFHTNPGMEEYKPQYEIIRGYQEKFVDEMLNYTLAYPHVLYCMNNETSTSPEWGQYWMEFIRDRAAKQSVKIFATDMFDDFWRGADSENMQLVFNNPGMYQFIDISQVNSRNFDQTHWDRLRLLHNKLGEHVRPINNTKIYGGGQSAWGSGTNEDGVERFWRHIIGGSAGARFHRPIAGPGMNDKAIASLKAVRKLETRIKMWNVDPAQELLGNRQSDEAYVAAGDNQYVVYFTAGGEVTLTVKEPDTYALHWIDVATGEWGASEAREVTEMLELTAPDTTGSVVVIQQADPDIDPTTLQ